WEEVSTERAHAAAVSAAEEQSLRQLHERQRVAPAPKADARKELRRAQRELQEAEAAVAVLEAEVARVVAALDDPALYTRRDGAREAHELGARLEALKRDLALASSAATVAAAQAGLTLPNAPQLRWELTGDTNAVFTLTNRDSKPLPRAGWAIYFSALHSADSGSVGAGFKIDDVLGDLHRLKPDSGFAGLAPGASIKSPYVTDGPLLNRSFVALGPYI